MDLIQNMKYGKSYYEEIQNKEGEKAESIMKDANNRYEQLMQENNNLPEKVKEHTDKMIFPAIATYQAVLSVDPTKAMEIMEVAESRVSEKTGASYRKLVSPPFMKGVFIKIFSSGTKFGFSTESGFTNHFIRDEKKDIAFNIEKCPYHTYCVKYGCEELTHIFCHNDINAYGNLPGITFERHETLGTGGSCCDFHLYIKNK